MKFIKKVCSFFTGSGERNGDRSLSISVRCDRCGEVIRSRIDLNNDLSVEYGEGEGETTYFCRKVLIGKEGCYLPIEVELKFGAGRNLIEKQIKGGKFADA